MSNKNIHWYPVGLVAAFAVAACVLGVGIASATPITIYQDDFDGAVGDSLNDRTPNTVDGSFGTEGAVWYASTYFKADGTVADGDSGASDRSGYLPFVPKDETGWIYTLEADIKVSKAGSSYWLSLGFNKTIDDAYYLGYGPNHPDNSARGYAWFLARGNNEGLAMVGPATANTVQSDTDLGVDTSEFQTYKIVLDMTRGPNDADIEWYVNETLWASSAEQDMSGITNLQIGRRTETTGEYSSLTLSAIPEPSSIGLILLGLAAAARLRLHGRRGF